MNWVDEEVRRFGLSPDERRLLWANVNAFDARQRRRWRRLRPRLGDLQRRIETAYRRRTAAQPQLADELAAQLAAAVVARGYATILETMLIDVVGRRRVAQRVRALRGGSG